MAKCQHCGEDGARKRLQNTKFVEEEQNYAVLCDECQKEADEYWRDMWSEYYNSCM